jgi:hypothetical protein
LALKCVDGSIRPDSRHQIPNDQHDDKRNHQFRSDALWLTFAQAVAPAEEEERDEDDDFGGHGGINGPGSWMR